MNLEQSQNVLRTFWHPAPIIYKEPVSVSVQEEKKSIKNIKILKGQKPLDLSYSSATQQYQNDKRNNIYTLGDFENKTPTHMAATHAISNLSDVFKIEFPWHWTKIFISPDSA